MGLIHCSWGAARGLSAPHPPQSGKEGTCLAALPQEAGGSQSERGLPCPAGGGQPGARAGANPPPLPPGPRVISY